MFQKPDYVMITVSDMDRSIAFYRDLLGFALRFASPGWTEFETGATTLALHGGGRPAAAPAIAGTEQPLAGTCSIGFNVPDVDATHAALVERGVRFVMPPMARQDEGIRLAVALDPDGLPIAFAQSL